MAKLFKIEAVIEDNTNTMSEDILLNKLIEFCEANNLTIGGGVTEIKEDVGDVQFRSKERPIH